VTAIVCATLVKVAAILAAAVVVVNLINRRATTVAAAQQDIQAALLGLIPVLTQAVAAGAKIGGRVRK